jgi:hypothetical protein
MDADSLASDSETVGMISSGSDGESGTVHDQQGSATAPGPKVPDIAIGTDRLNATTQKT